MVTVFDVPPQKLAEEVASQLKGKIQAPKWSTFVKTGPSKERPPVNPNWFYVRAASVLKALYENGPVGVSKLRSKYGGRKNRGVRPSKFVKASGNIIRKVLQQLDKAGLSKYQKEGIHKGRVITPQGISLLTKAAEAVAKSQ